MPNLRAERLISAIESSSVTSSELDTLLQDQGRQAGLINALAYPRQAGRLIYDDSAYSVLMNSVEAKGTVANSVPFLEAAQFYGFDRSDDIFTDNTIISTIRSKAFLSESVRRSSALATTLASRYPASAVELATTNPRWYESVETEAIPFPSTEPGKHIFSIARNPTTGTIVGITYDNSGNIWRSTDDGATWNLIENAFSGTLLRKNRIRFTGGSFYVLLDNGTTGINYIFKSTDEGLSFSPINTSAYFQGHDICINDQGFGYLLGGRGTAYASNYSAVTKDNGATWQTPASDAVNRQFATLLSHNGKFYISGGVNAGISVFDENADFDRLLDPPETPARYISLTHDGEYFLGLVLSTNSNGTRIHVLDDNFNLIEEINPGISVVSGATTRNYYEWEIISPLPGVTCLVKNVGGSDWGNSGAVHVSASRFKEYKSYAHYFSGDVRATASATLIALDNGVIMGAAAYEGSDRTFNFKVKS